MIDIVDYLRARATVWADNPESQGDREAADEIERLRGRLAGAQAMFDSLIEQRRQALDLLASGTLGASADLIRAEALMDARHLVIGTPGFQALTKRAAEYRKAAEHPTREPAEPWCDECDGPFPGHEVYSGHWDTCPNREYTIERTTSDQRTRAAEYRKAAGSE